MERGREGGRGGGREEGGREGGGEGGREEGREGERGEMEGREGRKEGRGRERGERVFSTSINHSVRLQCEYTHKAALPEPACLNVFQTSNVEPPRAAATPPRRQAPALVDERCDVERGQVSQPAVNVTRVVLVVA